MADRVPFALDVRFEGAHLDGPGGGSARPGDTAGPDRTVAIVTVVGEVDLATVAELRSTLNRVMTAPRQEVVVDLAAVDFIDASGVGALVGAAAAAARAGVKFRLKAPSPSVERVLDLARLDGSLAREL
jgi:anti-sigma B factor antagonist